MTYVGRVNTVTPPSPHCSEQDRESLLWRMAAYVRCFERDVRAVLESDPASRGVLDVVLTYPGIHALWGHRVAHALWNRDQVLFAKLVSHLNRFATGVEIHPGAKLGQGVFIDHGMGVVIGETARVGDNCLIYKGVVLGGTTRFEGERHPKIGKNVVIGTNAVVLGSISVADGARIGSGSVVIRDVAPGSTVVGVPGREIKADDRQHAHFENSLDHADLPDPIADMFRSLREQNQVLLERVSHLEDRLGIEQESGESESDEDSNQGTLHYGG